jgi:cation diffusion facilitator CzcD-associated flavoprotein CzcO
MTDVSGTATRTRIIIIGAGFGGIGLGIKLKASGLHDFVILEKSDSVGGVWRDNRYPGAGCDVPSHLYSFSFEQRADWPDKYGQQSDILEYLKQCIRKYQLEPHIRFGAEVSEALWDEARSHWIVQTREGQRYEAQALVTATGQLNRPYIPSLAGRRSFAGTAFHSAEWRQDYDLSGKRVAVIGTGASAIQFVPAIAALVSKLYVLQRSAPYVLPKPDKTYPVWQIKVFERSNIALKLNRLLTYIRHELRAFAFITWRAALRVKRRAFFRHLKRGITNPDLRERLIPDYRMGCKRILLSNDFYPAMNRPNVELVTDAITEIRSDAIVTADAIERKIDCIIFGTGFAATDFLAPMKITGRRGLDLNQCWRDGAEAHLGMTVAGFPNFFMLYGPNTNLAHNSVLYMIEGQIHYIMACLARLRRDNIRSLEVKKEIQDRYNARLQQRLKNGQWSKGCTSWYLTATGRNATNWPGYSIEYRLRTNAPNWNDYAVG